MTATCSWERARLLVALVEPRRPRIDELGELPGAVVDRAIEPLTLAFALREQLERLTIRIVEAIGDPVADQQAEAHLREPREQPRLLGAHVLELTTQLAGLFTGLPRTFARGADLATNVAQHFFPGQHPHHLVIRPPATSNSYSGSSRPRRFLPNSVLSMMPLSSLSRLTCS